MVGCLILARRTFTLTDQTAFAELSGDWNPMHVDPIAARRTLMGAPVVHGIQLVLWSLDSWFALRSERTRIARLRATFRKPAYLDRELTVTASEHDGGVAFTMTSTDGNVMELRVELSGEPMDAPVEHGLWVEPATPLELDRQAAAAARGDIPLAIDADRAQLLFPAAAAALGLAPIADLLASTRVVGMYCPGLHSLFSALSLEAHDEPRTRFAYEVANAKPKYSMIGIRVTGTCLRGTLDTFYRPTPRDLPMAAVAGAIQAGEFAQQRALVVGGSRGLGEAFAKVLASGGAEVTLTYHRGRADAERVAEEIRRAGGRATAIQLDVLAPALPEPWPGATPTHLYYLATPTLFSIRKGAPFKADELDSLMRYFTTGFYETIAGVLALGVPHLVVWTPSTTMLDAPSGGAAYCAAKAAMEELCRHLPSLLPVTIHTPRLGRVDTDQTLGLIQLPAASTLDVAVDQLRLMIATT